MTKKQKQLGGIFILLFLLWAGWVVLHEEKPSYSILLPNSWTNSVGYTEFEFTFQNRSAHELRVTLQATLQSYSKPSPPSKDFLEGPVIESKTMEVSIPAYEKRLVRDGISYTQELAATETAIVRVEPKEIRISTRSRVKGMLVQLFIGGLVLAAILLFIRLLPKH